MNKLVFTGMSKEELEITAKKFLETLTSYSLHPDNWEAVFDTDLIRMATAARFIFDTIVNEMDRREMLAFDDDELLVPYASAHIVEPTYGQAERWPDTEFTTAALKTNN
jgi:hypothetical protein